jgi:hypothetical protein
MTDTVQPNEKSLCLTCTLFAGGECERFQRHVPFSRSPEEVVITGCGGYTPNYAPKEESSTI